MRETTHNTIDKQHKSTENDRTIEMSGINIKLHVFMKSNFVYEKRNVQTDAYHNFIVGCSIHI